MICIQVVTARRKNPGKAIPKTLKQKTTILKVHEKHIIAKINVIPSLATMVKVVRYTPNYTGRQRYISNQQLILIHALLLHKPLDPKIA